MMADKQPVLKGRHSDESICSVACGGLPLSRTGGRAQIQVQWKRLYPGSKLKGNYKQYCSSLMNCLTTVPLVVKLHRLCAGITLTV